MDMRPLAMPRFRAKLHGMTIGWYDTAEEADAAIEAAIALEKAEEEDQYA
jgi:hypothetical protein